MTISLNQYLNGGIDTKQGTTYSVSTQTATAAQTVFNIGYSVGYIDVYQNGVRLVPTADFTASNGTTVVLATGASLNDELMFVVYSNMATTNALVPADIGASVQGYNANTVTGPGVAVDGEIALFDGTSGDSIKRATTTGILKATSGVIGAAVSGTDLKTINSTSIIGSGDITTAVAGSITTSGLTQNTSRLLGRTTASSGAIEEISVSGATLSGGTLTIVPSSPFGVLLGSYTVSGTPANIDFLSSFSGSYSDYRIVITGVKPSANDLLVARFAVSGSSDSGANYERATHYVGSGTDLGPGREGNTGDTSWAVSFTSLNVLSGGVYHGEMLVKDVNSASGRVWGFCDFAYKSASSGGADSVFGRAHVMYLNASVITGIRLFWSGGSNFTAGVVKVYGLT